jgi:hypothetical protein
MSDYYFAKPSGDGVLRTWLTDVGGPDNGLLIVLSQLDASTPMRTWFVGILFTLGVLMVLYSGFSWQEDWALNLAGVSALGVALFPTGLGFLHGPFAVFAFACLWFVAVFCAKNTLTVGFNGPNEAEREHHYRHWYDVAGWLMILFPVLAVVLSLVFWVRAVSSDEWYTHLVFWLETSGLWCFAFYWWLKGQELKEHKVEQLAAERRLIPKSRASRVAMVGAAEPVLAASAVAPVAHAAATPDVASARLPEPPLDLSASLTGRRQPSSIGALVGKLVPAQLEAR